MKVAIHQAKGFSQRWSDYCEKRDIEYSIVNCYDSDIVEQLKDYDVVLWHHHHADYRDALFAKYLLFSLENAGKKVFPNFKTSWHFDDKVAQKYLLESIGAPIVPSYVFYERKQALDWALNTTYPKVFKLRRGAGASNVRLIKDLNECKKIIKRCFGNGFAQFNRWGYLRERFRKVKAGKEPLTSLFKGVYRLFVETEFSKMFPREQGYAYFQEFIPNNTFDIRVIVIGKKAFAIKRKVRENDFRASGSGSIVFSKNEIDEKCVEMAFSINRKIDAQSIAYDFIFDEQGNPLIVEVSYGFVVKVYDNCEGYWDDNMNWYSEQFNPQEWMIDNLLNQN